MSIQPPGASGPTDHAFEFYRPGEAAPDDATAAGNEVLSPTEGSDTHGITETGRAEQGPEPPNLDTGGQNDMVAMPTTHASGLEQQLHSQVSAGGSRGPGAEGSALPANFKPGSPGEARGAYNSYRKEGDPGSVKGFSPDTGQHKPITADAAAHKPITADAAAHKPFKVGGGGGAGAGAKALPQNFKPASKPSADAAAHKPLAGDREVKYSPPEASTNIEVKPDGSRAPGEWFAEKRTEI